MIFRSSFTQVILLILAVIGAYSLINGLPTVEAGGENFWDNHGIFFLFFISLFPRLTLLLSSVSTGGVLWWLGFIFAPRLLVALLATIAYGNQNPILVAISWLICLSGESGEKYIMVKRGRPHFSRHQAIEAEFRHLD